jgi:hypothetical protein
MFLSVSAVRAFPYHHDAIFAVTAPLHHAPLGAIELTLLAFCLTGFSGKGYAAIIET